MTTPTRQKQLSESHHGVLLNISGCGVLILGKAGVGKSSLALDFLHQGHSLIADDCVDFKTNKHQLVIGCSPPMLAGLLHTRELGLISLPELFDTSTWQDNIQLNYVIRLQKDCQFVSGLSIEQETYYICEQSFPMLTLDINTPATLANRINIWLQMKTQHNSAATILQQRQHNHMATH